MRAGGLQGFERTAVQLTARGIARRTVDHGAAAAAACTAEEVDRVRGLCRRLRAAADEKAEAAAAAECAQVRQPPSSFLSHSTRPWGLWSLGPGSSA